MAKASEIKQLLNIGSGTWTTYISEGTVTKQSIDGYNVYDVAQQIIKSKTSDLRKISTKHVRLNEKYNKLKQEASGSGGILSAKSEKEALDLQIAEQKLIRMKHDNKVRKKEVMPVENVFSFVTSIASEFAAFLDPIIGKVKQSVPDMNAKAHDDLEKTFAIGRNNLSRHIEGKTTTEFISLFDPDGNADFDDE